MPVSQGRGQRSQARDRALIVFVIVACVVAAAVIWRTIKARQPYEVGRLNLPVGSSPKAQWLREQKAGQAAGKPTGTMTEPSGAPVGSE